MRNSISAKEDGSGGGGATERGLRPRRFAALGRSPLVQAWAAAEDARREARLLAEELDAHRREIAELRRRLDEQTAALHRAREAAEAAHRAKTRFLSAASHDLRQPIQAAALYAHVLRPSVAPGSAGQGTLDLLEASVESLNGMLSGLLDLSRLEAGAIDVAAIDFVPADPMLRLAAEFREQAKAVGVDLRCLPSVAPVRTDPKLLERVLRHLLSNAITHGARLGGRRVLLGCRRRGGTLEFQVWDNGPGIPEDAQAAIFEEFRQLDNPERSAAKGFGLGLSIVSRIARLLGLEVTVRSEVGRGTVFTIAVPLSTRRRDAAHLHAPASDPAVLARIRGRTVLLVEDDERVRIGLTMLLKTWGARVVAVGSAEELAARLPRLRRPPHVLLADHRLPGGRTGRNVVELVRGRWDVPAVIITGDTAPERLREAKSIGCRLLHKPVEPALLAHTLGEVIHI
ncbi:ATP-binding response regulator [Azospirillum sp. sgz302134]